MRTVGALLAALPPLAILLKLLLQKKRYVTALQEFERLVDFVREEIRYANREKGEIFKAAQMLNLTDAAFGELFDLCGTPLSSERVNGLPTALQPADVTLLLSFYNNLGNSDQAGALQQCDYYAYVLQKQLTLALEQLKSKGKLYTALFAALSLFVFIILC